MEKQYNDHTLKKQNLYSFNKLKINYHTKINYKYKFLLKKTKILYLYFIIIINFMTISQNNRNLQSTGSEITIRINGTGKQPIIYQSFITKPNKVYYNDEEVEVIEDNKIIIENNLSRIKLVWNTKLRTCYNMFVFLTNIIEVDLSNF